MGRVQGSHARKLNKIKLDNKKEKRGVLYTIKQIDIGNRNQT